MTAKAQKTQRFQCECGKSFNTNEEYTEHRRIHHGTGRSAAAAASTGTQKTGTQKSTAVGQEQGETARGDNQKGREEGQQGWRQPISPGDGRSGQDGHLGSRQDWREAKNKPDGGFDKVPQVGDDHEWKHGKQEDDTEDAMMDDWGKSDKH